MLRARRFSIFLVQSSDRNGPEKFLSEPNLSSVPATRETEIGALTFLWALSDPDRSRQPGPVMHPATPTPLGGRSLVYLLNNGFQSSYPAIPEVDHNRTGLLFPFQKLP